MSLIQQLQNHWEKKEGFSHLALKGPVVWFHFSIILYDAILM